ncbi:MAG: hypothetical protein ACK5EU_03015 [Pseudanabaena sp.]|uniref:hypothetical protein n=1 Tax=Pseudanabaena mucicola TaxID=71190 RepID=UPI0025769659|nr:hypothetical protein [Pseudanabaena mucicola]MCA6575855.1 hypothetical protein [Pseudanabaena sp. M53BS1SP1A06MG]MCA6582435.1 hypothetical protein [Pseudanabaena sp. M34BS1SP1A06MG]MCA6594143.1 hypothetical protein [Pseudanabaena sp. M38BS1SP1A06MG]MCA6602637.1 hypothetical protein [Pseudanabaena sp. M57BS1SP1A06MG]MCA6605053.1 hypothetical protein [Pseudanabaena sp. M007S1SP1A06QC]
MFTPIRFNIAIAIIGVGGVRESPSTLSIAGRQVHIFEIEMTAIAVPYSNHISKD